MLRRIGATASRVAVALTVGGVLAGLGSFVAWRSVDPAPDAAEARAAVGVGLPGVIPESVGWHDDAHDLHGMAEPTSANTPGQQQALLEVGSDRAAFAAAPDRLRAAGWTVVKAGRGPESFVVHRGDRVMEWELSSAATYWSPTDARVEVWMWRYPPTRVHVGTLAGWLVGAALGWWLAGVARRRFRGAAIPALAATVVVLALSTVFAAATTAGNLAERPVRGGQPVAVWQAYWPFLVPFGYELG